MVCSQSRAMCGFESALDLSFRIGSRLAYRYYTNVEAPEFRDDGEQAPLRFPGCIAPD